MKIVDSLSRQLRAASSDTLASAAIYILGLGSLLIIDISVASNPDPAQVATWALTKGIVFVSGPIALLGLDHAIVRNAASWKKIVVFAALQVLIVAATLSIVFENLFAINYFSVSLSIGAFASSLLFYSVYRSNFRLSLAQLSLQGWKIILLLLLVLSYALGNVRMPDAYGIAIGVALTLVLVLTIRGFAGRFQTSTIADRDSGIAGAYRVGALFAASNLLLNLSLYAEQFFLNAFGTQEEAASLFAHVAIVAPGIVALNGYISFWLTGKIRQNKEIFPRLWNKYQGRLIIALTALALFSTGLAWLAVEVLNLVNFEFSWKLALFVCGLGIVRTTFIFYSTYSAIWASKRDLAKFVVQNVLAFITCIFAFFAFRQIGFSALDSVLVGSGVNWITRLLNARQLYERTLAADRKDTSQTDRPAR